MGEYLVRWIDGKGRSKANRTLVDGLEYEDAVYHAKRELQFGDEAILRGVRIQVQEDTGSHKYARWTGTRIGRTIISVSGENALHIDDMPQPRRQGSGR